MDGFFSPVLGADTLDTSATALAQCTQGSTPVIFAGGECGGGENMFEMSGNFNDLLGDVHANDDILFSGNDNEVLNGEITYVEAFSDTGTNNTYIPDPPDQVPWMMWPPNLQLDPTDYAPGGSVASMYPGQFFEYYTDDDVTIDNSTLDGVHVIHGDGKFLFSGGGVTGTFTLVILPNSEGKGTIELGNDNHNLTGFHDDILFFSDYWKGGTDYPYAPGPYGSKPDCGDAAIQMSGSNNTFTGLFVAPRGMIQWNGNLNTLTGGLAGFNLRFNGEYNTIDTIPGGGVPITVLTQ